MVQLSPIDVYHQIGLKLVSGTDSKVMVLVANPTDLRVTWQIDMRLGECKEVELVYKPREAEMAVGNHKVKAKGNKQGEETGEKESRVGVME